MFIKVQDQDSDVQDQERDSKLTRPILESPQMWGTVTNKSHGKQKIRSHIYFLAALHSIQ